MADLSQQIEQSAQQPKSGTFDGQTFTQHSLKEQIEADKYLESKKAATGKTRGLAFAQLRHPGAQ